MKIVFANVPIALSFPSGGTDAITGFWPEAERDVQVQKRTRAAYGKPKSRSNATETVTGTIAPAPFDAFEEALLDMYLKFRNLPEEGALTLSAGSTIINYPDTALRSIKPVYLQGVAVAYAFTFICGEPQNLDPDNIISDESGNNLTDETGDPIRNQ